MRYLDPTPLLRPFFALRCRRRQRWADVRGIEAVQRNVLASLLAMAKETEIGRRYGFGAKMRYEDFAAAVPVVQYEDIRSDAMRMVYGESDVLWRGKTKRFAQSSGTSGGKSKYIPVTDDSLRLNHYAGAAEAVVSYLDIKPDSHIFGGKSFILGGSFANELSDLPSGTRVGDLSASLIDRINPAVELLRVPSRQVALMSDWTEKLPALVNASAATRSITNISGVPSWFLTVLRGVLERTGAKTIHEVWPNLEVFFHGGISFEPYRSQYQAITDPTKLTYIENYNASEGFFAVQDTVDPSLGMRLLLDIGVFYEFIPLSSLDDADGGASAAVPAWGVEEGKTYALLISSCNGLWRYLVGDTVTVKSTAPLRISIAGRTSAYINAFGEELMVWNADSALATTCHQIGARVADYTAAPVYTSDGEKGHHQWLIEWQTPPTCGNEAFADILDKALQTVNSDYQAKRAGDLFLSRLDLVEVPTGTFDAWLAMTGKRGGQRKVPRLANNRNIVDAILKILNNR